MANGIKVPKKYNHLMREGYVPREHRIADIRDYVKAHEGEIITMADFMSTAGSSSMNYVPQLIREGRLIRSPLRNGTPRVQYTYKWIDLSERKTATQHGAVIVKSLGFKDWPLGGEHSHKLMATEMDKYIEENIETIPAEQIKGMLLFKKHINGAYVSVETQRKQVLESK